jgi:hypothetical protein
MHLRYPSLLLSPPSRLSAFLFLDFQAAKSVTHVDSHVNRASVDKPEIDLTREISSSGNASYFDDFKSGNPLAVQLYLDESGSGSWWWVSWT